MAPAPDGALDCAIRVGALAAISAGVLAVSPAADLEAGPSAPGATRVCADASAPKAAAADNIPQNMMRRSATRPIRCLYL